MTVVHHLSLRVDRASLTAAGACGSWDDAAMLPPGGAAVTAMDRSYSSAVSDCLAAGPQLSSGLLTLSTTSSQSGGQALPGLHLPRTLSIEAASARCASPELPSLEQLQQDVWQLAAAKTSTPQLTGACHLHDFSRQHNGTTAAAVPAPCEAAACGVVTPAAAALSAQALSADMDAAASEQLVLDQLCQHLLSEEADWAEPPPAAPHASCMPSSMRHAPSNGTSDAWIAVPHCATLAAAVSVPPEVHVDTPAVVHACMRARSPAAAASPSGDAACEQLWAEPAAAAAEQPALVQPVKQSAACEGLKRLQGMLAAAAKAADTYAPAERAASALAATSPGTQAWCRWHEAEVSALQQLAQDPSQRLLVAQAAMSRAVTLMRMVYEHGRNAIVAAQAAAAQAAAQQRAAVAETARKAALAAAAAQAAAYADAAAAAAATTAEQIPAPAIDAAATAPVSAQQLLPAGKQGSLLAAAVQAAAHGDAAAAAPQRPVAAPAPSPSALAPREDGHALTQAAWAAAAARARALAAEASQLARGGAPLHPHGSSAASPVPINHDQEPPRPRPIKLTLKRKVTAAAVAQLPPAGLLGRGDAQALPGRLSGSCTPKRVCIQHL